MRNATFNVESLSQLSFSVGDGGRRFGMGGIHLLDPTLSIMNFN